MSDALEVQGEALPEETVEVQAVEASESPETVESPEESAPSESEPDAGEKPKKHGIQKRIDELVRQRAEAAREAQLLREQLEAMQRPQQPTGKPSVDQFGSYEEYLEALSDWKVEQRLSTVQQTAVQSAYEREMTAKQQVFQERAATFEADDFAEVAFNPSLPVSDAMRDVILDSEIGPQVLYHLGRNPSEAARIAQMSPVMAAAAIGRLEAKLTLPQPKTVSSAPPPIKPIAGRGEPAQMDPLKLTVDEWIAKRNRGEI